jgi:hypothetical protein
MSSLASIITAANAEWIDPAAFARVIDHPSGMSLGVYANGRVRAVNFDADENAYFPVGNATRLTAAITPEAYAARIFAA